jgi:hypothetical protein
MPSTRRRSVRTQAPGQHRTCGPCSAYIAPKEDHALTAVYPLPELDRELPRKLLLLGEVVIEQSGVEPRLGSRPTAFDLPRVRDGGVLQLDVRLLRDCNEDGPDAPYNRPHIGRAISAFPDGGEYLANSRPEVQEERQCGGALATSSLRTDALKFEKQFPIDHRHDACEVPEEIADFLDHSPAVRWVRVALTFSLLQLGEDAAGLAHEPGGEEAELLVLPLEMVRLLGRFSEFVQPRHRAAPCPSNYGNCPLRDVESSSSNGNNVL